MASQPRKPRSRSRRKASPPEDRAPAGDAEGAVVLCGDDPAAAAPDAAPAESAPHADPGGPSLDGHAEAVAVALAELADAAPEAPAEPDESAVERIRSVHELLARTEGEVELLLFRIGAESFAFDLAAAEEAVELEGVHGVPDMPDAMLGVFDLRGRLVPVYSPAAALRVENATEAGVLLLMRAGDRRVGIVVDDVQDVVVLIRARLRPPPSGEGDGLVLGVAFFGDELVTILDAHALVASCALPATAEAA
ncbi:MAG TPA: chemotaxis protein CheW [Gemmatimonadaceae bacterium]|nr:chemotaxis protein CheW [Gemmatimonadaceae bacterium]